MVLNFAVVTLVVLVNGAVFDETYFRQKAAGLRGSLASANIQTLIPFTSDPAGYLEFVDMDTASVVYTNVTFHFKKSTGAFRWASSSGSFPSPPEGEATMTQSQLSATALVIANIFEPGGERSVAFHEIIDRDSSCLEYQMSVFPCTGGIRHIGSDFDSRISLEHSSGRLVLYSASRVPRCNPPATLTPTVSLEDAVATAASHVGNVSDPPPVVVTSTPFLCIYKTDIPQGEPNLDYRKTWFNSADWAAFNSNTGVLAYSIDLALIDAYIPDRGVYSRYERCYVNAMDGRLMAELSTMGIGGGGRGARTTFSGELELGPLTLRHGKSQFKIVDASTVPTSAPTHPASKRLKVMLVRGKLCIQAEFDPKSGLLRFGGKTPTWAKPNLPLLAALRKLTG